MTGAVARRATFREFGEALVREVATPRFLQAQLDNALKTLLRGPDWLADFAGEISSARAEMPTLIEDDGYQRRFAVTIQATLGIEVGPRTLAAAVEAYVEVDLTVRVGTFSPTIVRLDIDPVRPADVRVDAHGRSDWLPQSLVDVGGAGLALGAQRSLPMIAAAVNHALEQSAPGRQVDVLGRVRAQAANEWAPSSSESRSGTLQRGEHQEWPFELGQQERGELQLWAGIDADQAPDPPVSFLLDGSEPPPSTSVVELSVTDADGELVEELTLEVIGTASKFDPVAATVEVPETATGPTGYRARLANQGPAPLAYRVEQQRTMVAGKRISFAEFGEVLIARATDRDTVSAAITNQIAGDTEVVFDAPRLLRGTVAARLVDVTVMPAAADQRRYGLTLEIDVELLLGPGANATVVTSTLQAQVSLGVSTTVGPAALQLTFDTVTDRDLRLTQPPYRVGGRRIPIPRRALAELLPRQVIVELNRRLVCASRRIIATEVAAEQWAGFVDTSHALRSRTSFTGVASVRQPGRHSIRVAENQRIRVEARVVPGTPDRGRGAPIADPDLAAELAVCDEHGGIWAASNASIAAGGEPTVLGVTFTAPRAGQWRLRMSSTAGPGNLNYELEVRNDVDEVG